ncbi:MAG: FAD-dependent oxidoreductase [Candidatus Micrarchaeota archaeon]|nr:FAD-dependent oxidoreductase [Candidatus Micrarchaeota archaeon]
MAVSQKVFDVAIVGGGPAGMSAAVYAARRGLAVVLFEGKLLGGTVNEATEIDNYLGFSKTHGMELSKKFAEHVKSFPIEVREEAVVEARAAGAAGAGKGFSVKTANGECRAKSVVLAMGAKFQALNVPGEKEFAGKGVSYCATCDGYFFKGKRVAVVGGGDSALSSALYLSDLAKEVLIIHRRGEFRAEEEWQKRVQARVKEGKIRLALKRNVVEIRGKQFMDSIVLEDAETKARTTEKLDGIFVYVGSAPLSMLAKQLGVELTEKGFVKINDGCSTNVPGVFAAGDITGKLLQIAMAVAQGAQAALSAYSFLRSAK